MTSMRATKRPGASSTAAAVLALAGLIGAGARAQDQPSGTRPGWPCVGHVDPVYVRQAEGTGGRVLMLHPTEMDDPGAAAVSMGAAGHDQTVMRIVGRVEEGLHEFEVPIDSTIESVNFFVSLQCLQIAQVVGPSRAELRAGDPSLVEDYQFEAVRYVTVARPAPGTWKISVAGRGLLFLVVTARSGLSLDRLSFLDPGRQVEAAGQSFRLPESGKPQRVEVGVAGAEGPVTFHLVSSSGTILQRLALEEAEQDAGRRTYRGQVVLPGTECRLAATGVDARGFPFQRVEASVVLTAPK